MVQIRRWKEKALYIGCCAFGAELPIKLLKRSQPTSGSRIFSIVKKMKKSERSESQAVSRLCSAVGPGVSGVRLKKRDCEMTAASGLCWSVGTSEHHKANLSSKMLKRLLALHSCMSVGLKSGTLIARQGWAEMQRKWQIRCGSRVAWPNSRPGEAGQNRHRFNGGPPNEHYGLV
jgi:hypothetical protein